MSRAIAVLSNTAWMPLARYIAGLVHPYRPELHYMRGPGPAWHAKHDHQR